MWYVSIRPKASLLFSFRFVRFTSRFTWIILARSAWIDVIAVHERRFAGIFFLQSIHRVVQKSERARTAFAASYQVCVCVCVCLCVSYRVRVRVNACTSFNVFRGNVYKMLRTECSRVRGVPTLVHVTRLSTVSVARPFYAITQAPATEINLSRHN